MSKFLLDVLPQCIYLGLVCDIDHRYHGFGRWIDLLDSVFNFTQEGLSSADEDDGLCSSSCERWNESLEVEDIDSVECYWHRCASEMFRLSWNVTHLGSDPPTCPCNKDDLALHTVLQLRIRLYIDGWIDISVQSWGELGHANQVVRGGGTLLL